jgi:hypothetical protein
LRAKPVARAGPDARDMAMEDIAGAVRQPQPLGLMTGGVKQAKENRLRRA